MGRDDATLSPPQAGKSRSQQKSNVSSWGCSRCPTATSPLPLFHRLTPAVLFHILDSGYQDVRLFDYAISIIFTGVVSVVLNIKVTVLQFFGNPIYHKLVSGGRISVVDDSSFLTSG